VRNATEAERQRAVDSARLGFQAGPVQAPAVTVGEPQMVRSVLGEPSYWLVPGFAAGQMRVLARILRDGRLATIAQLREPAADCAAAVTGMSAPQALQFRAVVESQQPGGTVSSPTLVHDGPVGREAWLYQVRLSAGLIIWTFATAGGSYSRPAGAMPTGS
jgi:hypothetical protein